MLGKVFYLMNILSTFPMAKVAKARTIFILKFNLIINKQIIVLCGIIFNLFILVLEIDFQNALNHCYCRDEY